MSKAIPGAPWTLILGAKGAGKSRLAGTVPNALCVDTEPPGGASAFPKEYWLPFPSDNQQYSKVKTQLENIRQTSKREGRSLMWNDKKIDLIVVDTFDMLQKFLISRYLEPKFAKRPGYVKQDEIWAPKMEQQDWGALLNYQSPLMTMLKSMNIPVVWTCHTKVSEPLYEGRGDNQHCVKKGAIAPDISGSIEGWILNLCDYILNIVIEGDGQRKVYTQPVVIDDYAIVAADRHRLFADNKATSFNLPVGEDGFPTRKVIQFILENHDY